MKEKLLKKKALIAKVNADKKLQYSPEIKPIMTPKEHLVQPLSHRQSL